MSLCSSLVVEVVREEVVASFFFFPSERIIFAVERVEAFFVGCCCFCVCVSV